MDLALPVASVTLAGAALLTLVVTTGVGARRRGCSVPVAVLAGLTFPGAWVVWYVRDERPPRGDAG